VLIFFLPGGLLALSYRDLLARFTVSRRAAKPDGQQKVPT
jgi:hypothetical protein